MVDAAAFLTPVPIPQGDADAENAARDSAYWPSGG